MRAPLAPNPGDRVRVLVYDDRAVTGRLHELDAQAILVDAEPDGARRVLSRESIAVLQVERERPKTGKGAAIGFLAGGVAGLLLASAISSDDEPGPESATAFVTGTIVGTVAGALIGKNSSTTRWRKAPLP